MDEQVITQQIDATLRPFLQAADGQEADSILSELIAKHAQPIVKKIISSYVGNSTHYSDRSETTEQFFYVEYMVGEFSLQILHRLQQLKSSPNSNPISNFQGYVITTAYNVCNKLLRQKYPERARLKNKLRYIL